MTADSRLISEQIQDFRTQLRNSEFRAAPLEHALRDRIQQVKNKSLIDIDADAFSLLHTLDWALSQPQLIDPELLITYITELIRLMENAGAGLDFRIVIDKALSLYEATDRPVVDLYLAKVEYLRLTDTESRQKEETLKEAAKIADKDRDRIKVLLRQMQYYIDTSQYEQSIEVSRLCQALVEKNNELRSYLPKVYDLTGITYFYHFDYTAAREQLVQAVEIGRTVSDAHTVGEASHYLGRIAMAQGDAHQAMEYFISGWQYQPDNLADSAWYHLRMGNLLTSAGLIQQAKDHYQNAQDLFIRINYDGSALVQIELGWGDVRKAEKKYDLAERHYHQAFEFARSTGFSRGELLSLVKIFWLQLFSLYRADQAVVTFMRGMTNTEVRRNLGARLVLSYLMDVLLALAKRLRGESFNVIGISAQFSTSIESCICPMHSKAEKRNL